MVFSLKQLFFRLLENNVFSGFWIVLLEFDLAGHKFLVLASPIHLSGAFVLELYEEIL